jgi:bifunctional enzyme CysN/CysC
MEPQLLRFTTAGSVDDGKSTLIGRLLHDSDAVYEDQLEAVRTDSGNGFDLAFITDGLKAEREQCITIDVAYRYFSTSKRRFIITDTPGHEQYTRNMATGASNAELAVVLLDARKGVVAQTRRHAHVLWLLGIKRMVVAVNKMDLVGFKREVFEAIQKDFQSLAKGLDGCEIDFIPVSALEGDNVVRRSCRMPWAESPSLLEYLEAVPTAPWPGDIAFRFPVQYVIHSGDSFRSYAGQIVSGSVRPGDEILALASGCRAKVKSLSTFDGDLPNAFAPMSTSICLDRDLDISRGDMLVHPAHLPAVTRVLQASLFWMSDTPLKVGQPYLLKHTTQQLWSEVTAVTSKLDLTTLDHRPGGELSLNDIGTVTVETYKPLFCDEYAVNRRMGSFILIDSLTNLTVGAGTIRGVSDQVSRAVSQSNSAKRGLTIWFTGLSSAGKTTLSKAVGERLWARGHRVELLDGDEVRRHLSKDLGFSRQDRDENIRRIAFVAELLTRNGVIVLVSAISPYRASREEARRRIGSFVEVFVNAPLSVCEQRDRKGLYKKARGGEITGFTGIDDPYEPPLAPEVQCDTDRETEAESVAKVINYIDSLFG